MSSSPAGGHGKGSLSTWAPAERPRSAPWRPKRWALHSRIAIALGSVGVLLIGVVATAVVLQVEDRQAQHLVINDYYDGLRISQSYYIQMLDAETAVRGYALTGRSDMLQPLQESGRPWDTPIESQVALRIPKEKAALASLSQVEKASQDWYHQWAEPSIQQIQQGGRLSDTQVEDGKARFDQVRVAYQNYIDRVRGGRQQAAEHLHTLTNLLFAAVITAALIAVGGGYLLWGLLRRWVSRPVAHLAAEARTVSAGDLEHEVTARGPLEFVELGADVEAMRRHLVAQIAAVEQAGQEVAAARALLEDQTSELQRSNRELEQFAYVASHDLQEPLRKVASFCQMLERRYSGQLDERADQYIHFAVDGAKRMQQLINDLLEFSRVGRLTSPRVEVSLNACLRSALGNLETAREESGAEVTSDDLPSVLGEAPLLTQLLQNLIGNAIKFHGEQPPRVHLGVRADGSFWEFWCSDNGIGIEPEYADRVFLIFQRLHAKEVYTGTGIGLAMCKKIVEHHGGRIWVADTPGEGATIRWTLPVLVPGAVASALPSGEPAAAGTVGRPS